MTNVKLQNNAYLAIKKSNIEDALMYIQQINDINFTFTKQNDRGHIIYDYTLLHLAAEKGLVEVATALLNRGANAAAKTDFTRVTPLYIALEKKKEMANQKENTENFDKIITLLIENKPELCSMAGYVYNTPLHLAASSPFMTEQLALILNYQNRVEINVRIGDSDGNAPLHLAAQCNNLQAVELLVKNGASITCRNKDHKTAIDLTKNKEIKQYLESNKNVQQSKIPNALFDCTTYEDLPEAVTLHSSKHRAIANAYDKSRVNRNNRQIHDIHNDDRSSANKPSRYCVIS